MSKDRLFTFRMVPLLARMLAARNIDGGELVAQAKLPPEAVNGEVTAPLARILKLVQLVADKLEAPNLGLQLAELVPSGAFGVAEFLVRAAPNLETGLSILSELAPLINAVGEFRFVADERGGEVHYSIAGSPTTLDKHLNEYTLAYVVKQIRLVMPEMKLTRVWFSHQRTADTEAVTAWFQAPVEWKRQDCGFAVDRATLDRAPRTADAPLFQFLLAQGRAQLAYVGTHDLVSQVVRVIEVRLAHGEVDIAAISHAMATTPRSLQRGLAAAGTSFRAVLAHVRSQRRDQLARAGKSPTEIAHALGFADARSMRRSIG
ncbi:MAG TPA: AraC family transcriptional regulator ligand-binding domain-containing protein [Kofleriaceae bacterium]